MRVVDMGLNGFSIDWVFFVDTKLMDIWCSKEFPFLVVVQCKQVY